MAENALHSGLPYRSQDNIFRTLEDISQSCGEIRILELKAGPWRSFRDDAGAAENKVGELAGTQYRYDESSSVDAPGTVGHDSSQGADARR